jgi:hypothetical protein
MASGESKHTSPAGVRTSNQVNPMSSNGIGALIARTAVCGSCSSAPKADKLASVSPSPCSRRRRCSSQQSKLCEKQQCAKLRSTNASEATSPWL